jgi:hypothetical protein
MPSLTGDKKPIGFAMHTIAGGIAGACEAVNHLSSGLWFSTLMDVSPKSLSANLWTPSRFACNFLGVAAFQG